MNSSHRDIRFGSEYAEGLWQAMDHVRSSFEKRAGGRRGRGDVRTAIVALLAEQPMHGYQIIREIDERSDGEWKLSAGSVYPTLQLLVDEGLIVSEESNGRKVYTLTDAGREAHARADGPAPWATARSGPGGARGALPKAGMELAHAVAQVGRSGTAEQIDQAIAALDDTRRRLYSILAQD